MIYTYDCTQEGCGASFTLQRPVADRNAWAACPCSRSHQTRRRAVEGTVGIAVVGGTRHLGWQERVNQQHRAAQVKQTVEETF